MVNRSPDFPIRWMCDIRFPVRMIGEFGCQHYGKNAKNGREDEPLTRISVDETITHEHARRFNRPIPSFGNLLWSKRIMLPENFNCFICSFIRQGAANGGDHISLFHHCTFIINRRTTSY